MTTEPTPELPSPGTTTYRATDEDGDTVLRGGKMTPEQEADLTNHLRKLKTTIYAKRSQHRQVERFFELYGRDNVDVVWQE